MRACLLAVTAGASLATTGATPAGAHSGEFASKQKWFKTSLSVVEGDQNALVSYGGFFGPGCSNPRGGSWCRSCEFGPALVPRAGPTSFLFADEDGKVRVTLDNGAWLLVLDEGAFSGCGVGWWGDSFRPKGTPPRSCVVAAPQAQLRVPGESGLASAGTLSQGFRVLVVTGQLADGHVMVRAGDLVGLLDTKDVRCPAQ